MKIKVNNWEEYNARNDIKNPVWFRFQNDFFEKERAFMLSDNEKIVLIYILCQSSKKNGAEFDLGLNIASAILNKKSAEIIKAVEKLTELQIVASLTNESDHQRPDAGVTRHNSTLHNKTKHNNTCAWRLSTEDADALYDLYPKKIGKGKGYERMFKQITSIDKRDKLEAAIKNYSNYCKIEETEKKYIKQFSTFMNCWEDWVDHKPELSAEQRFIAEMHRVDKEMEGVNYFESLGIKV